MTQIYRSASSDAERNRKCELKLSIFLNDTAKVTANVLEQDQTQSEACSVLSEYCRYCLNKLSVFLFCF